MTYFSRTSVLFGALFALAAPDARIAKRWDSERPAVSISVGGGSLLDVFALRLPASLMIRVPRSSFSMGSTDDEILEALVDCQREPRGRSCDAQDFSDEQPRHRVTVSAFWLDRSEVAVHDYQRCVERGPCRPLPYHHGAERFSKPDFPVSLVTWNEAVEYCTWRGARLPTEAEFERAARGEQGRTYPWGNLYNSHAANHGRLAWTRTDDSDSFAELAPVGSFPAGKTRDGFLDLAGNVAEWVHDRYASAYSDEDPIDPDGPPFEQSTRERVVRGGSFESPRAELRGAARAAREPNTRSPSVGFRCARSAIGGNRSP